MRTLGNIKKVPKNGQISLGKKFAGKQIQVYEEDDNTIVIKSVITIPESELWLYRDNGLERLTKAIDWAESHEPKDNFEEIIAKLENGKN